MSTSRKFLKIASFITLVSGVIYVVAAVGFAGAGLFGGSDAVTLGALPFALPAGFAGSLLVVVAGVTALINLALGLSGLRAANVPSRVSVAYILSLAGMVAAASNLVLCMLQGFGSDLVYTLCVIVGTVTALLMFVFSRKVKSEHETWH